MGFLDTLLGRTKPVKPDLDALFALPAAALTLEAALGLRPTGLGSVAVKAAEGGDFARAQGDAEQLMRLDPETTIEDSRDSFGYLWLAARTDGEQLADLVTALHGANTTFESAGFGPGLLCSLVSFHGTVEGADRTVALVYLYKRGAFYPFAPLGGQRRDSALELQLRGHLEGDLPLEADLQRWFPVWDAPGLPR